MQRNKVISEVPGGHELWGKRGHYPTWYSFHFTGSASPSSKRMESYGLLMLGFSVMNKLLIILQEGSFLESYS